MSGKLDQSLDEIVNTQRRSARRNRGRRVTGPTKTSGTTASAPVGGVKKSTRPTRSTTKGNVPTGPAFGSGDSKIIVSNLPSDVNEGQIKDYFTKAVGPVKKCIITYGPNGASRGIATVIFSKADGANRAATHHNGLLVDGKPLKIEVVVDASRAPAPPPVKGLGERIAQPKAQPKSAAVTKSTNNDSTRGGRGRGRGRRGRNGGRGKPKTADELDAEMADYFDAGATGNGNTGTNGAAPQQAVANTDTGMDDDIM